MPAIAELKRTLIPATQTSQAFPDNIYMWAALYVTWLLIKLKLTADQVTYLSGLFCIIGGVGLAMRSAWLMLAGVVCFIMFHILDCCDGYVARYRRESSVFGRFLDWYMHFVRDAAMFAGLAFGAYSYSPQKSLLICGFLAVLAPIMHKTILNCGWTAICWERLVVLKKGRDVAENIEKPNAAAILNAEKTRDNDSGKRHWRSMIFVIITAPFSFYAPVVLIGLVVMQIVALYIFHRPFDFRPAIIVYSAVVGTLYLLFTLRKRSRAHSFENGYQRLFAGQEDGKHIQLPRDYFFQ